jgi:SAM-dependent methyltransferase
LKAMLTTGSGQSRISGEFVPSSNGARGFRAANGMGGRSVDYGPESTRQSRGLEQVLQSLTEVEGLSILDLGGASQANINYITNLGHRLCAEDVLMSVDALVNHEEYRANPGDPHLIAEFLEQCFDFPDEHFGGALLWDSLQYLPPPLLEAVIQRLHRVMRPSGWLLTFFSADDHAATVPSYSYRIADPKTLLLHPRGARKPAQYFNNRALERLFQGFGSIKFFLTRDSLREVIVRR